MSEHPNIDPSATVDPSASIADSATIGPGVHVGPEATIGEHATLEPHAVIGASVIIGPRSSIGASTYIAPLTILGEDVTIGPNASIVGDNFTSRANGATAPAIIGNGAAIGANATVIATVTVGPHAIVGAGSVVDQDVPPHAKAIGSPAQIVGYRSPGLSAANRVFASSLSDDQFPFSIGKVELSLHPVITDLRGSLTFGEVGELLPFEPKRYFLVYDVPSREVRGEHSHHELHELLICVTGECSIAFYDGHERGEIVLDRPDVALHLPPLVWSSQYRYSPDAVLMVLASHVYEADDYIRSYDQYLELIAKP